MAKWIHRLSNIDGEALTGECANCGPVEVRLKKNGTYHCRVALRAQDTKRNRNSGYKPRSKRKPGYPYKYGNGKTIWVTLEERQRWIDAAESRCAICDRYTNHPHLDHCHQTGKIRGVLCSKHNTGLGKFNDSIDMLYKAIEYLQTNG